ncbi:MFS transporter [Streptomyces sp. NPDC002033]|uniref:MFS transporter n=1 Tax=unclassified Streptomyces TaxID=2593676 RepID=UPI00332D714F
MLGVPAGTLLGELGGWRSAFAAVGALGAVTLAALLLLLPPLPPARRVTARELPDVLRRNRRVRTGVAVTFLVVTGQFAAYTFVRPVLRDVSGIDASYVSTLLLGYGLAGVAGNFLAGPRDSRRTLLAVSVVLGVVPAAIALVPGAAPGTGLLLVWGLAYGGVSVSLQRWMLPAAPLTGAALMVLAAATVGTALRRSRPRRGEPDGGATVPGSRGRTVPKGKMGRTGHPA